MSIFESLINVVVEHPVISGSAGAFIAAVFAGLFQMGTLCAILIIVGIALACLQILI